MPDPIRRSVNSRLVMHAYESPRVILQVAVSGFATEQVDEELSITCDGVPLEFSEMFGEAGTRTHVFAAQPGLISVDYRATVTGRGVIEAPTPDDAIVYVRPSRYAESDRLAAPVQGLFGSIHGVGERLDAVVSWVHQGLAYVPGLSRPTDGAVETMLSRLGVCRDFAHLVIAMLRALDIPARFAAVYAPGLSPMDFHAVPEVLLDGRWVIVDATGLAPRSSMVRIATGRDAADTAFASVYGGAVDFYETWVSAVVDGDLPIEDLGARIQLS